MTRNSTRIKSWKIRDANDDQLSLPQAVLLKLKSSYELTDLATQKLWFALEAAMQPTIYHEPEGEAERSKKKAKRIMDELQAELSAAKTALVKSSAFLEQIYFINPVNQPADDNPYDGYVRRLESLRDDLAKLQKEIIGFEAIYNGLAHNSHVTDVRRQRISWAAFEALIESGHQLNWTYDLRRECRENAAISMINEISEHLMEPFETISDSTLHGDWKTWRHSREAPGP